MSAEERIDAYYITWENKKDKSRGISKVTFDGNMEIVEAEIERTNRLSMTLIRCC